MSQRSLVNPVPGRAVRAVAVLLAALLSIALPAPVRAQLAGSNLLLGQVGNWPPTFPDRGTPSRQSFYDLLDLQFTSGTAQAGVRFETDRNSDQQFEYEGLTRRFADWSAPGFHVRLGNVTTILGRGLVHRSFELSGVVLENTGFRTRYTPSRDVDGVLVELERGPVRVRALSGSPSEGTASLANEKFLGTPRHRGQIAGGQFMLALPREARVGAAYLRGSGGTDPVTQLPRTQETGSGFVELDLLKWFGVASVQMPVYAEYAQHQRTFGQWWSFARDDAAPHAMYASANLLWRDWALSLEWKDYAQFRLGTNDPPSLVREHSAVLLNRSTHILVPDREQGYQAELSWSPRPWASALANLSRGDLARGDRFEERYGELRLAEPSAAERWELTAFVDRSADSTVAVMRRFTVGARATLRPRALWSVTLDAQRQTATRSEFSFATFSIETKNFENVLTALTATRADWGSLGVQWERTTDDLDPSWEFGRTRPLHFVAWTAAARVAEGHEASLFVGRRRGGPACTAGTCYEVQPFEGVELRLVSRF